MLKRAPISAAAGLKKDVAIMTPNPESCIPYSNARDCLSAFGKLKILPITYPNAYPKTLFRITALIANIGNNRILLAFSATTQAITSAIEKIERDGNIFTRDLILSFP